MAQNTEQQEPDRALAAAHELRTEVRRLSRAGAHHQPIATGRPSKARLRASHAESPIDLNQFNPDQHNRSTVLYLAYGSNLSIETFRKKRGIKPLAQVNVQVPSLRLTFDLPGIPYQEPCFANSGLREDRDGAGIENASEDKTPLLFHCKHKPEYRKDRWHKGLIGVVYEVTAKDFAHIIATEGGGAAYKDILVECYPFASDDPNEPIPDDPTSASFKAHTLFAPSSKSALSSGREGHFKRSDTSFAQPSPRYLKLITDGAAELGLPYEYQEWLHSLHPYQRTTYQQTVGMAILLAIWFPIIFVLFTLGRIFSDKKTGKAPTWLSKALGAMFERVWKSYDGFFKDRFGDGERTIGDDPESTALMQEHAVDMEKKGLTAFV